ncbi:orotidine-5'-phosphate decarboxylase [Methanoculleus sp. 7T]|jgi:orotidine-5'-phosphate decarboxylase|uniref:orotidine-5'-phosphate decarboxylase n=1 Tax=Methanoculleus sp. 7T TaxID=2937282 RepID=UPI0020BF8AC6|nr:orotidine-5'-phosphate decarboxylase [Methanoculleus sp. 7T]MCK8518656.1 orotidine-5'-phosphate decarboxylase [Methanoculleus sp. 7T]
MTELILALDVLDRKRACAIAESCASYIDAVKIGYPLVLSTGLSIVEDLAGLGLPLIADFKVADIPNTNRLICEAVFSAGFDAVIAQGFVGADAARACVEVAHNHGGAAYIVAEMSHPGATEFFHGGVAERLAALAVSCRADGIIAPATRPDRIGRLREIVGEKTIYSPGVGAQGGDLDTVARLVDGVIVGRSIYEAEDPGAEAERLARIRR